MTRLMRVAELIERPVVTLDGDDLAQIRDVVFDAADGSVNGFTLADGSLFGGPRSEVLAWSNVSALGPDAVMVADETAISEGPLPGGEGRGDGEGDVIHDRVVTDSGVELGTVVDAIVEVSEASAYVVGYEMVPAPSFEPTHGRDGRKLFVPRPETLAVSNEAVIVPAEAIDYVADDLAGFGEAVESFRTRLQRKGA